MKVDEYEIGPEIGPGADLHGMNLVRADLRGACLQGADLSAAHLAHADLQGANLRGANLTGVYLTHANLREADLYEADLSGSNLMAATLVFAVLRKTNMTRANLISARLNAAIISGADLSGANLDSADLRDADLAGANMTGVSLIKANLCGANLSGAQGLPDQAQWMRENFEADSDGYIVYKAIGGTEYKPPAYWRFEEGSVLDEVVNPDRCTPSGCGVNFAPLWWCRFMYPRSTIWRCRIEWRDLINVVVPYGTDGEARCKRLVLLEKVE